MDYALSFAIVITGLTVAYVGYWLGELVKQKIDSLAEHARISRIQGDLMLRQN